MTAATTTATHPLSRLSAAEISAAREIVETHGLLGPSTAFAYVGLDEPDKGEVRSWKPGDPVSRDVRLLLLDRDTGQGHDVRVSLSAGSVTARTGLDATTGGQIPILDAEFGAIEPILALDERWVAALAERGLEPGTVRACPLSAGSYFDHERGRRIIRVLGFHQPDPTALPWAHPVDGLVAYVDVVHEVVTEVHDHFVLPVPAERGDLDQTTHPHPVRELRPIEITQPDGPSFTVDDDVVTWAGWQVRIGFDAREGLVLHELGIDGRSVIHRASIAEMVVPYGDPSPERFWQNYFDTGEYLFARYTNSLARGCDCLGEIHYLDAVLADEQGHPRTVTNAICLHEEDVGVGWKHTDAYSGMSETRRSRRLVISFFTTIGNYDYGFYWYLYTDGTIELQSKATGVVFTSAARGEDYRFSSEIAPGLAAPFHQHLFSARLDMAVDGDRNTVYEVDAARVPMGGDNPYGNAFTRRHTALTTEKQGVRDTDATVGRTWHVANPSVRNRLGRPVGYTLHPQAGPTLLADAGSSVHRRATFASHGLWVTAYDRDERYPAGDFVNQHPGGGGLPAFVDDDAPIEDTDVVLWHTFGLTHFPRPEDWPVMPVDDTGFVLKPEGFFDRNPALGVPPSPSPHCREVSGRGVSG